MFFSCLALVLCLAASARAASLDVPKLEGIIGKKAACESGRCKFSLPQDELNVAVEGFSIVPDMGLKSWLAFTPHAGGTMLLGELVLLEDEVKPIQEIASDNKFSISALHNRLVGEVLRLFYLDLSGTGKLEDVAQGARKLLDKIHDLRARPDVKLEYRGTRIDPFLSFSGWLAFQGTPDKASVNGEIVLREGEAEAVARKLIGQGIEVTAIYDPMIGEKPRVLSIHLWGADTPANLARKLKAALDKTPDRKIGH